MTHLESTLEELVLDLDEVALALLRLEGLVDDGEAHVVLDVLVPAVAVPEIHLFLTQFNFSEVKMKLNK